MIQFKDVYTTEEAAFFLYGLCKERASENKVNISFKLPTWQEHLDFIGGYPFVFWDLILEDKYHGYVSLTTRNEIGIVLSRDSRGQGIGKRALEAFMKKYEPLDAEPAVRPGHFVANINPENERSIKLFTGLGFNHVQNTYSYEP